jgi:hypothetical protein
MITYKTLCVANDMPIPVEMKFEGIDPYSVHFVFHTSGAEVRWDFSKELLDDVMKDGVSGEGDVKFLAIDHNILMTLSSPEGEAMLELDPCNIEEFLSLVDSSPEMEYAKVEITDDEIYGWLGDEAA